MNMYLIKFKFYFLPFIPKRCGSGFYKLKEIQGFNYKILFFRKSILNFKMTKLPQPRISGHDTNTCQDLSIPTTLLIYHYLTLHILDRCASLGQGKNKDKIIITTIFLSLVDVMCFTLHRCHCV